jgi:hypothetical protein
MQRQKQQPKEVDQPVISDGYREVLKVDPEEAGNLGMEGEGEVGMHGNQEEDSTQTVVDGYGYRDLGIVDRYNISM